MNQEPSPSGQTFSQEDTPESSVFMSHALNLRLNALHGSG